MANLRDKNDRAVRAFITSVVPAGVPIYIALDPAATRDATSGPGLVDVLTGTGIERPVGSGNYTFNVRIRAKITDITQPTHPPNENRALLGSLVDEVFNLLHQSDNGQDYLATALLISQAGNLLATDQSNGADPAGVQSAKDNADMTDYSCLSLTHDSVAGDKVSENSAGSYFIEVANFSMNVVGYGGYWN